MWTGDNQWSWGFWIGLPILVILLLFGIAAIVIGLALRSRGVDESDYEYDGNRRAGFWFVLGGAAWFVIVALIGAWAFYPYSAEYHQWREVSGTVQEVDSRIVPAGSNTIEQKIVVTYDNGLQVGCLDTRCAGLREGDVLTLKCKRQNQWFGVDGYDCSFVSKEDNTPGGTSDTGGLE